MADKKLPYNWERVSPGDIISFKYKTQATGKTKTHTVLVLNPALITKGQKRTSTLLCGIKLEESNRVQLEITAKQIAVFNTIGKFVAVNEENNLYKLDINQNMIQNDVKGVKPRAYNLLSKGLGVTGQYRTYDYYKARANSVYLEPIRLFTKLKEEKVDEKPKQPEKPKKPKKPKQPKKPAKLKEEKSTGVKLVDKGVEILVDKAMKKFKAKSKKDNK